MSNQHLTFIENAIASSIRERAKEIVAEEGEKAAKEVVRRLAAEIDRIALSVAKNYDLSMDRQNILIRVQKP